HMPVHLGAMPSSVESALELEPGPGDVVVSNDPFRGGTHLPDITVVKPVYVGGAGTGSSGGRARPLAYLAARAHHADVGGVAHGPGRGGARLPDITVRTAVYVGGAGTGSGGGRARPRSYLAARAHHADVGGMAPGSMPLAREVFQEGLRIPPVRLMVAGERQEDVWRLLLANVRTPEEREGDLAAQVAALVVGERRLAELVERRGAAEVVAAMAELRRYGERLVRAGLARIPDGAYEAEEWLEGDGLGGGPFPIRVRIVVRGDEAEVDFTGTAPQAEGGVNAVGAITVSCVRYVLRCVLEALLGGTLPAGGGDLDAVRIVTPEGSLVAATPPAGVAAGNVETSQRIADVLLLALAEALPELIPAQSQGTMNNLTIGGRDPR